MFRTIPATAVVAVAALLLVGVPRLGQAQLVVYDDFKGKQIDPSKWQGSEGGTAPGASHTDTARRIHGNQLELSLTSWGKTDSDVGNAGTVSQRLGVTDPASVTTLQAEVVVKRATVNGCAANSTATRARAQLVGGFFSDGTSPSAGNRIGDILAGIQKVRDSIAGDVIEAFVQRCINSTCGTLTTLNFYTFATSWVMEHADTLRLAWDPGTDQFHFAVNPGTPLEESVSLPYTVSDTNPPVVNFKILAIGNSEASCTEGRTSASMEARFDNVMVNPSP